VPHAVTAGLLARLRCAAAKRGGADHHPRGLISALRAGRGFIALGNAANRFEVAAFGTCVVVNWHGVNSKTKNFGPTAARTALV